MSENRAIKDELTATEAEIERLEKATAQLKRETFLPKLLIYTRPLENAIYLLFLSFLVLIARYYYNGEPIEMRGVIALAAIIFALISINAIVYDYIIPPLSLFLTGESGTRRSGVITWFFVLGFLLIGYAALRRGFDNIIIEQYIVAAVVSTGAWWYGRRIKRSFYGGRSASGLVLASTRNEFPSLSWTQEEGTGESKGRQGGRIEWRIMQLLLVGGVTIGFIYGGWAGALMGGAIGAFLAGVVPRDAAIPDLRLPIAGSTGAPRSPRQLTERERQIDAEPVTRRVDCEAFCEVVAGDLLFCLARGDKSKGPLPIVAQIPMREEWNFEYGSHAEWLRSRSQSEPMSDWHILFVETPSTGVTVIAEWVHDKKWITDLQARLRQLFAGVDRAKWLAQLDAAKQGNADVAQEVPAAPAVLPAGF